MRIEVQNGEVVCVAEDWNALEKHEREFLSDCYWNACWTDFTAEGNLSMRKVSDVNAAYTVVFSIISNAEKYGIEVSEDVVAYKEALAEQKKTAYAREAQARAAELRRANWKARKSQGCDFCQYCKRLGDASFQCLYSGDELDCRIGQYWDGRRGVYELFHESGEPNEHCKDFYKEEIQKTEDIKNEI